MSCMYHSQYEARTVATVPVQGPVGSYLYRTASSSIVRYDTAVHDTAYCTMYCVRSRLCASPCAYMQPPPAASHVLTRATRALWGVNRHAGEDGRGARARCDAPDPVSRHLRGRAGQTRWRRATSAAVGGVRSRFAAAVRAGGRCRGVIGADFPGRRPCWTSGRGGGRCDWAVCEVVK
jgi:hypothetical protein